MADDFGLKIGLEGEKGYILRNIKESDLGLDKLRTLYYKKEMFSENQNA